MSPRRIAWHAAGALYLLNEQTNDAYQLLGARRRLDWAQLPHDFRTHFTEEKARLEKGSRLPAYF